MNEKIKELAEQAEKYANEQAQRAWHHSSGFNPFKEKFAELIVKECAEVCRNQPDIFAMKLDRDNCAIAIEEHFGIEDEDEER